MINLSQLSKEQIQKLVLGVIVGLVAIFGLFRFAWTPLREGALKMQAESAALDEQITQGNRLIKGESRLNEELLSRRGVLQTNLDHYVPLSDNALTWATLQIQNSSRRAGVEIDSINEMIMTVPWTTTPPPPAPGDKKTPPPNLRKFTQFAISLSLKCSYRDLTGFLSALEENPYLTITALNIQGPDEPGKSQVNLIVCWPMWSAPQPPPAQITLNKGIGI